MRNSIIRPVLLALGLLGGLSGCASYRVGTDSLYAPDIRTLYVPMIESDSFRRDLGERLTEAIVKEIELKTPYKVVSTPNADAVLSVRLLNDTRKTVVEDTFDAPRALENQLRAEVTFVNRRRVAFSPNDPQNMAAMPRVVEVGQSSLMVPAVGQTIASSQQVAIERLAQQIVGTMEEPW